MYSAIITGAIFTAIVLFDLIQNNTGAAPQHALLGFFATVLMFALEQKGLGLVSWGLLILPIVAIVLSIVMVYLRGNTAAGEKNPAGTAPSPTPGSPQPLSKAELQASGAYTTSERQSPSGETEVCIQMPAPRKAPATKRPQQSCRSPLLEEECLEDTEVAEYTTYEEETEYPPVSLGATIRTPGGGILTPPSSC